MKNAFNRIVQAPALIYFLKPLSRNMLQRRLLSVQGRFALPRIFLTRRSAASVSGRD